MKVTVRRAVIVVAGSLLCLTGCETTSVRLPEFLTGKPAADADATGSIIQPSGPILPGSVAVINTPPAPTIPGPAVDPIYEQAPWTNPVTPSRPSDDLSLGKEHFKQGNYGLSERYFRKAVESGPENAEAWLGLAAAYDRLRRFGLADRAYDQTMRITGRLPEILNNLGYSYMLRGDFARSGSILREAAGKDPTNPYIQNNLRLLTQTMAARSAVR